MAIKWKQLMSILQEDGLYEVRQKGSHKQLKNAKKIGLVIVSYHKLSDDVPVGTYKNILRQAQLDK